ncbi:MAG TPA: hypothetical protein VFI65_30105 [Streptosporangiaceae bacterium]|nr:hypothetical protein [Streptosporangiaceae bacterium]
MPGVAGVLGKTGLVVGLGLVLIGPTVQGADAILPAPGKTAAGHETDAKTTPAKASSRSKASSKSKANRKARHKPRAASRQVQFGADLKPGAYTAPIVTHRATNHRATNHRATNHRATTRPAKTHPGKHPKPPGTTPKTKAPTRSRTNPVIRLHRRRHPSLAGTWSLFGGEFKFARTGLRTISDTVISQRIGVFCPAVNDQDGQLVVRQIDKFDYIGTWQWFNPKTCESAGYGSVKIMVWRDKLTATFTAYPPAGQPGPPDTTKMERLAGPAA